MTDERSWRLEAALRTALITYGIAAYVWLLDDVTTGRRLLVAGLAVQVALAIFGRVVRSDFPAQGRYIAELLGDGVTVLLFAAATYAGIVRTASDF